MAERMVLSMKKLKVKVSKCYLVQLLDEDGNELGWEYDFCNKKEAEQYGKEMKEIYIEDHKDEL